MRLNPDYFDMFKILNTAGVRPQDLEDVQGLEASRKYVKSKKLSN